MPPRLPSRPSHDADLLTVGWISQLLDCVRYAMEYPIGDRKTIMRTSTGTLQSIRQGATASAGDTYTGMFKVINTSTSTAIKLKIIDGFDPEADNAGIATISDKTRDIPVAETTVTASGAIIMETLYDDTGEQVGDSTIKYAAGYTPEADKSIVLLSRFTITDGKLIDYSQEQHGPIVTTIDGGCE